MDDIQINRLQATLAVELATYSVYTLIRSGIRLSVQLVAQTTHYFGNKSWGRPPTDRKYEYIWYDQQNASTANTHTNTSLLLW